MRPWKTVQDMNICGVRAFRFGNFKRMSQIVGPWIAHFENPIVTIVSMLNALAQRIIDPKLLDFEGFSISK